MKHFSNLSNCHQAPMLVAGDSSDVTRYYICTRCSRPCDGMVYPFETKEEMMAFLETRKMTGSVWTSDPKRTAEWHAARAIGRIELAVKVVIVAVVTISIIGILVAFAAR